MPKAPLRVLCVYGTESGTSQRAIIELTAKWKEKAGDAFEIIGPKDGNAASTLEALHEKCDVLIVATSSYNEGDPPDNFMQLFCSLLKAVETSKKPLQGKLQHAVLGFGASSYETFQNCPRLTDKLLEECGSRRLAQRQEIDDQEGIPPMKKKMQQFEEDVLKALLKLPAVDAPPVCKWSVPEDNILEKQSSFYAETSTSSLVGIAVLVAIIAVIVAWQMGTFN